MSYLTQAFLPHLRLSMLRALAESFDYEANDSLLRDIADQFGINASRDQVRGQIDWLAEQQLVTVDDVKGVKIVRLTERGLDVAKGRAHCEGVKRPGP